MNNNFKELTDFLDEYNQKYTVCSDCVKVDDWLYLNYNNLKYLPESFGNLKIGGNLYLDKNELTSLPESFGNLKIGGDLRLEYNNLTSLPESFCNIKIGGDLFLDYNNLTSLPESFCNIKIGGDLRIYGNKFTSLPESFGNLKIGGRLCFDWSKLQHFLPDSFFTSGLYKKNRDKNLDELYSNFLKRKEHEEMIRFKSQIWVIG